jgi:hypothetical protein
MQCWHVVTSSTTTGDSRNSTLSRRHPGMYSLSCYKLQHWGQAGTRHPASACASWNTVSPCQSSCQQRPTGNADDATTVSDFDLLEQAVVEHHQHALPQPQRGCSVSNPTPQLALTASSDARCPADRSLQSLNTQRCSCPNCALARSSALPSKKPPKMYEPASLQHSTADGSCGHPALQENANNST